MAPAVARALTDEIRRWTGARRHRAEFLGDSLLRNYQKAIKLIDNYGRQAVMVTRYEAAAGRNVGGPRKRTVQVMVSLDYGGDTDIEAVWREIRDATRRRRVPVEEMVTICHDIEMDRLLHAHNERPAKRRHRRRIDDTSIADFGHVTLTWVGHRPSSVSTATIHAALGLAGEVGETVDLVKKLAFKPGFYADRQDLLAELGDIGYYWAVLCRELGFEVSEVMAENKKKLVDGHGWVVTDEP